MHRALELAARGSGKVSPNPLVGAVIVKNDQIIGESFHQQYGGDHAELAAIKSAKGTLKDATLYCTLSPCHDCLKMLCNSGIKRVVYKNEYDLASYDKDILEMLKISNLVVEKL